MLGVFVVIGKLGVVVTFIGVLVRVILEIFVLLPQLLSFPFQHTEVEVADLASELVPIEAVGSGLGLEVDAI